MDTKIKAAPAARKLAKEYGIDLADVTAQSGQRITASDVTAYMDMLAQAQAKEKAEQAQKAREEENRRKAQTEAEREAAENRRLQQSQAQELEKLKALASSAEQANADAEKKVEIADIRVKAEAERIEREAELKRIRAVEEAKARAEEEAAEKLRLELSAKEEALRASEQARIKAEEEAQIKAKEEMQRRAELEAKLNAEAQAKKEAISLEKQKNEKAEATAKSFFDDHNDDADNNTLASAFRISPEQTEEDEAVDYIKAEEERLKEREQAELIEKQREIEQKRLADEMNARLEQQIREKLQIEAKLEEETKARILAEQTAKQAEQERLMREATSQLRLDDITLDDFVVEPLGNEEQESQDIDEILDKLDEPEVIKEAVISPEAPVLKQEPKQHIIIESIQPDAQHNEKEEASDNQEAPIPHTNEANKQETEAQELDEGEEIAAGSKNDEALSNAVKDENDSSKALVSEAIGSLMEAETPKPGSDSQGVKPLNITEGTPQKTEEEKEIPGSLHEAPQNAKEESQAPVEFDMVVANTFEEVQLDLYNSDVVKEKELNGETSIAQAQEEALPEEIEETAYEDEQEQLAFSSDELSAQELIADYEPIQTSDEHDISLAYDKLNYELSTSADFEGINTGNSIQYSDVEQLDINTLLNPNEEKTDNSYELNSLFSDFLYENDKPVQDNLSGAEETEDEEEKEPALYGENAHQDEQEPETGSIGRILDEYVTDEDIDYIISDSGIPSKGYDEEIPSYSEEALSDDDFISDEIVPAEKATADLEARNQIDTFFSGIDLAEPKAEATAKPQEKPEVLNKAKSQASPAPIAAKPQRGKELIQMGFSVKEDYIKNILSGIQISLNKGIIDIIVKACSRALSVCTQGLYENILNIVRISEDGQINREMVIKPQNSPISEIAYFSDIREESGRFVIWDMTELSIDNARMPSDNMMNIFVMRRDGSIYVNMVCDDEMMDLAQCAIFMNKFNKFVSNPTYMLL